jgi:multicomponent K+:H+ antiporter subunit G
MIQLWGNTGTISIQELLIAFFLFITAPVTAHFLAQAYLHTQKDPFEVLPVPSPTARWSVTQPKDRSIDLMTSNQSTDDTPI